MTFKTTRKTTFPLALLALLGSALAAPAFAGCNNEVECGIRDGFIATTFSPILLPISMFEASTENSKDPQPHRMAFLKNASIDAAQYLAGAEIGPNLQSLIDANPTQSVDQIVDGLLEAMEKNQ